MTTEMKKEGEFYPGCVTDIYDALSAHNNALKALGALLCTSDLKDFSESNYGKDFKHEASNLRWGVSQIIDLYLDRQEKILSEYCDLYYKSDIYITQQASSAIEMVEQGAWASREAAADRLREEITGLDIVINRNGKLKEKAAVLKEACLKYLKVVTGKETADRE